MNKKEFEETAIVKGMKISCENQNGFIRALCEELLPDEEIKHAHVEYEIASICYPDRCFMIENHGGVYFENCEFVKDDAYYKFNGDPWPRPLSSNVKVINQSIKAMSLADGCAYEAPEDDQLLINADGSNLHKEGDFSKAVKQLKKLGINMFEKVWQ